jgi:hypothetical protein
MPALRPDEIGYIEAHGKRHAGRRRDRARGADARVPPGCRCTRVLRPRIGEVEHRPCDTAAGIAGLIKTVLALRQQVLPPTLHYRTANPELGLEAESVLRRRSPAIVACVGASHRRVSSLGVGGTNCHVIVEEAPAASRDARRDEDRRAPSVLVPLSAATPSALEALEARVREFVRSHASIDLNDLAATAQRRRAHHRCRVAIRCATLEQLAAGLTGGAEPSADDVRASGGLLRRWQGRAVPDVGEGAGAAARRCRVGRVAGSAGRAIRARR